MAGIKIYMLGRFEIVADGVKVIEAIGNSKKRITLLEYLLLNRDKPVYNYTLIDILWGDEEGTNPENALKTLVSRLRSSLSELSPLLSNCIITENGSYRWNPRLECEIDVVEFERLCGELGEAPELSDEVRRMFMQIMQLYKGDLLPGSSIQDWVVARSIYLHNLYLSAMHSYIDLLKQSGENDEIAEVCRAALDVDAFDETLQLELMRALMASGHNNAALIQYKCVTNMYYKHLGVEPSARLLDFYKELIKADLSTEADINCIRRDLEENAASSGAFVCDYSIFKDIYKFQLRNLERLGSPVFIALVTVDGLLASEADPLAVDKAMSGLLVTLKQTLRKGDTIARYSSAQYAILLPGLTSENGSAVLDRIRWTFYKANIDSPVRLTFQFSPIGDTAPRERQRS